MSGFPALTVLVVVACTGIVGTLYVRSERQQLLAQVEAQLSAVADLEVSQIAAWRGERLSDARAFAELLAPRVEARRDRPHVIQAELGPSLRSIAAAYRYAEVLLVDLRGRVLATAGEAEPPPPAEAERWLAGALREGATLIEVAKADGSRLDVVAVSPLFASQRPALPLGGLILRIDPRTALFPLVQPWPTPSASGEALLVRTLGGSVVALNELRRREPGPAVRLPLEDARHPAVRVVRGEEGLIRGINHRGVEVLAKGRAVPGSPWFVVAKIDAQEILAPARAWSIALAAVVVLLAGMGVGSIALGWRHTSAVAERARFEDTQRQQAFERHLELLSEHADDVVLLVDFDGRIVRANDRAREQYGWSRAELVGQELQLLRAPGHQSYHEHLERLRVDGRARYETVHRRRDGSTFPVEVSARRFEADGHEYFQAVVRDVSERERVLAELSYQAEMLRNVYDGVIGLDADHVIRSWNAGAERIYGVAAADAVGRPIQEILPSEYRGFSSWREFVDAVNRFDRMPFEVRRRMPDGRCLDIEASAVVLRDAQGRISGYATINRDVTVRKRAEAALRASQERLARILETSNEAIWIVDAEGRTDFVNARAAQLFGCSEAEALGRPLAELIPEPARASVRADLESLARGESIRRELSMRRPDGSEPWLHHSQSALRDGDGRVVGAVGVLMDVTEQRLAREQLLQAHKMEAVGQLASGIAHDFNNLLVAILTCSEFLLESIDGSDPRRVDVEEIRHAGQRAALLVRRLLTFARKGPSTPTIVDLPAIVRGMEQLLRRTLGDHVELSFRLEPGLARIDPGHLEQVLLNLAVNARDAMPAGGRLHVETRTAPAEGHSAAGDGPAPDRQAVLTVADSGCGIPPEVLPRIFEPFFTTKGEGQGTGLGLSTVYGIVRQAGGRIAVDSAPGRGTTFRVCLPSAETAPAEAPSSPARANVRAAGGRRILLVEDDELVRRAARRMLEKAGHSVVEARCAVEALRRLEGPGIDLVLSDAIMPCRSGLALASQIASVHPALPVILMSGSPDPHRSAPGARPLLDKPFTAEALLSRIEEELRLAEAEPPRRGEPVSSGKPPR